MLVPSTMLPLGTRAPDFNLPDYKDGGVLKTFDTLVQGRIVVVMFICNHCPYVLHILAQLNACIDDHPDIAWVAINANDVEAYPEDHPDRMQTFDVHCPYLFDASQQVAKAYQASCTPDFYLFDQNKRCIYRGRFDGATPGNHVAVTGHDLRAALLAASQGQSLSEADQKPSMGCNIKWRDQ